jgi:FecR protein
MEGEANMITSFVRSILGAAILGAAMLAMPPAMADDVAAIDPQARVGSAGWRVDGVTGEAMVRRGEVPAARLAVGQVVSIGSEVQTGPGTVVFLSRNGDRLVIQPNSQMRIAEPEPGGLIDHFMQSLGSVFYDVEPRRNRSFGVSAPYVAAVVKGTRFLVSVEPTRSSVRVDEGRVLVTSEDGAASVLVDAGHVATVDAASASAIDVADSGIPVEAPDDTVKSNGPVEDGASGAADPVDAAADSVADAVDSSTNALGDAVANTGDAVGDTVGNVSEGVGDAVGGASGAVGGAVSGVGDAVGDAVGGPVGDAVSDTTDAVGDTVSGVGGAVGGLVGGVGGAVGGVVGGVGGALGGAVGGLGGGLGGLLGGD